MSESFGRCAWAAWIGPERDGDGQSSTIHVAPTDGAHVTEADAEVVRSLLRNWRAASPAALDALERAVIDAAIRVHDSQQASGSTLAPGERGIGGQMMTAWIRAEPFEELLDATYALLRERDRARLAHPEKERSGE